ncbi:AAA family ATPase [Planotetraspora kaengkrachanensis]|uniref:Nuclease SbcCD subunit C n=1 Tax=Planotetraspora kaengkrachanensis TaxID=575193 RepID=A0A8J3V6D8_9ACTN|nr:SMC family ATPase [Planotetraspora kaengkrachanensis]GIG81580.1 nuclease SbcCD subunit C [Planotetraspora kaengkrachanensis]
MRLHRLRLEAFGSFPGSEEVDFDALGEAGLFLIHGATGAGKTTVLDAVCYALYGRVPGRRDSARSLRCDHAPPGRGPAVTLEATIRGRRLRVTRSPAWMRSKQRGEGLVEEKAKVVVEEFTGTWIGRTTRADEAGHLIGELLGMNAEQFWQVAMLPQGDFASFLQADGDDRRRLLEKLFSVKIYTDMETWLADLRTRTGREQEELRRRADSVVDRMRGAAGADLPVPDDEPETVVGLAAAAFEREAAAWTASETRLRTARGRLQEGRELAERRRRHADALARREALDGAAEERADIQALLDDAARAAQVLPLIRQAEQRSEAAAKALRLAADATGRALPGEEPPGEEVLADMERERLDEIARVRQLLPEEIRLRQVRADLDAGRRRLAALEERGSALAGRLAALPEGLREAERLLDEARLAAAGVPGLLAARDGAARAAEVTRRSGVLEAELTALTEGEQAILAASRARPDELRAAAAGIAVLADAARLAQELGTAERVRHAAVDEAQAARDRLQEVRRARIEGMAAELAASLVEGEPCAVCGSADHPAPATPTGRALSGDDEQAAQDLFERTRLAREKAEARCAEWSSRLAGELRDQVALAGRRVAETTTALAALREEAGRLAGDPADLEEAERNLRHAEQAAARVPDLAGRAARLAAERDELAVLAQEAAIDAADTRARDEQLTADEGRLAALVDAARSDDASLAARLDRLTDEAALLREAGEATRAAVTAEGERRAALTRAAEAATGAGFAGIEHAGAAVRAPADLEAMAERLRFLDGEEVAVGRLLADPELVAAAAEPAPDLVTLDREHDQADREHGARTSARDLARETATRLTALAAELRDALARHRPAAERHRLARRLAELAGGTSADNQWHMRLSAFVLGERLRQVVEAANERLGHMSSGRYLLQHDLRRAAGDRGRSGGGLGLRVLDAWTGVDRDPATLSGGESFITSLALALGLADVVTAEAGGAEIGTLFVDEGFGTLDEETLDDVLDILDGLREGGRAVGIVSHVAELRVRVPVQLRIVKGRAGSTLA